MSPKPSLVQALFSNPYLLTLAILLTLVTGFSATLSIPRLEDPLITQRNSIILTPAPGMSAARVEALVSQKIEIGLEEIEAIKNLDSTSSRGISIVSLELADWVTEETNEQIFAEIRDKLADTQVEFPAEVLEPIFDNNRGAVAFTYTIALTWDHESPAEMGLLTRKAEELAERFRRVSGTELVRIYGDVDEEIHVLLNPNDAAALQLNASIVAETIQAADAKASAGQRRDARADTVIEVEGALNGIDRIREIPLRVTPAGQAVRVGDIAEVSKSWHTPVSSMAVHDGRRAVYVAARVQADRQADQWTAAMRTTLEAFRLTLGNGMSAEVLFEQNTYTTDRLTELIGNLALGAALILVVVFFAMGWRSAWIVGLALPLTVSLTLAMMAYTGGKIHQMSVFGMIIALGLLIDNAIVVTDDIVRRRRSGASPVEAFQATLRHLFAPLLASTTTTVLAFMPILLLPGNVGDFVGSIGTNVVTALLASLLVAFTLIASLAARFGIQPEDQKGRLPEWMSRGLVLKPWARRGSELLRRAYARPWPTMGLATILPLIGFILALTMGLQFFPRVDRDQFNLKLWLEADASLARNEAVIRLINETLNDYEGVEQVSWMLGESFPSVYYNLIMTRENAPEYAQAVVRMRNSETVKAAIPKLQAELDTAFPEAQIVINQFAQGPPVDSDIEFRIYGEEIAELLELGEQVRTELASQPEVLHTQMTTPRGESKLWFQANESAATSMGLSLRAIAGQMQTTLEGALGGTVLEDLEELPVRVQHPEDSRQTIREIEALNILAPHADSWVPLTELGTFELRPELPSITRRNGSRVNSILGYTTNDALPIEVNQRVLEQLDASGFEMPAGYHFEQGGDSENQQDAVSNLVFNIPILVTLTVSILILSFRSIAIAGILGTAASLSAGVGLLSAWALGFPISFNVLLGLLGLLGLAFNSSIVVLAGIRANPEAAAGEPSAVARSVGESSRHLISTTLTTMGGFVPLLLFVGGDFWPPLAIVMAGGVAGSTLLAIFFTPCAYRLFSTQRQAHERSEQVEANGI